MPREVVPHELWRTMQFTLRRDQLLQLRVLVVGLFHDGVLRPSLRQADASDEIGEAGIRANRIPNSVYFLKYNDTLAVRDGLFNGDKGLVFFAQADVGYSKGIGQNECVACNLLPHFHGT